MKHNKNTTISGPAFTPTNHILSPWLPTVGRKQVLLDQPCDAFRHMIFMVSRSSALRSISYVLPFSLSYYLYLPLPAITMRLNSVAVIGEGLGQVQGIRKQIMKKKTANGPKLALGGPISDIFILVDRLSMKMKEDVVARCARLAAFS